MQILILLLIAFLKAIESASWNPWGGTSMQLFQRGVGSTSQSFTIQQSTFYQASYVGYFKFTSYIDPTKYYSLMKLQISGESYTFLHLYIYGLLPKLRIIFDDSNISYDTSPGTPAFLINVWYLVGFGFDQSIKYSYLIYQNSAVDLLYQYPVAYAYSLPSRITQFELCIACQPREYFFTQFTGQYSTIKMITSPTTVNPSYKFFVSQHNMSAAQLQIYQGTAAILTYVQGQYITADLAIACTTSTKVYFDGLCIDNTQCPNIIYNSQTQFGIQNPMYYNSGSNQCLQCPDNCSLCNASAVCQSCNSGFTLNTGTNSCQKCSSGNFYNPNNQLCVVNCPSNYFQDNINQICVQTFNAFYHLLNPILIMSNFNQNDGFALVDSTTTAVQSDQFTQCYLDVNSVGFYTILGGQNVLSTYQFHKKILGLPKNFQKTITFQAIIYNNGQQGDFNFQVNNNLITLSSFTKILANQQLCTDNQIANYYQLTYVINDSTTDLDIYISTNKNGWGIRNFSMNITKCHSTCLDCTNDGNPWSCTSCQMYTSSISVNNNCACNIGQYAQFKNCYSSPCYACASCPPNCISCEDQTGKCTSCSSGYTIQNGACALSTSCNSYYTNDPASSFCIKAKDLGLNQFINNRISSNLDYWQYVGGQGPTPTQCFTMNWAPFLAGSYTTTLAYQLQNYNLYHYQYEINLTVTNIDLFPLTDYIAYSINGQLIKNGNYNTASTTSYCYIASYGETIVYEVLTYPTKSSALTFLISAHLTAYYFTFKDVIINYTRCHASCSNCAIGTSCSSCIANASVNASLGNICSCNAGYYFYYDWNTLSGQCKQCNPFCKTCYGPNITDCLTCQESYKVINSICVNACNINQYWDFTLHQCVDCSDCCASCTGTANSQCKSCNTALLTFASPVCNFNSDGSTCNSCNTNVVNSLCGGTTINHNYCTSLGWISYNSNTCVQCYSADSSGNCGGGSSYNSLCNQKGYFYSPISGSCFYCGKANGTNCGDPTINVQCVANKWIYKSLSNCISCLLQTDPLCCDNTCKTCNGQYNYNCLSCYGGYILFNGYCLEKCPNGYQLIAASNTCQYCPIFTGIAACNNCNTDCNTCAAANPTNCLTCYGSRQLNASTNRCNCKDPEDTRMTFYECSQNNQAVLDIVLSNTGPYMTINFGKILLDLPGFASQEYSNNVCKALFDATNLQLIGVNALCQVQFNIINITLDQSATIMNGQFLNFLPNVLQFKLNSSVYITTFLNNIAFQQLPQNTAVVFKYNAVENSCNDYTIVLSSFTNDSGRGFFSVAWTLLNPTSNADDVKIQSILSLASSAVQGSILIPKGIISINTSKSIQVSYVLKNTYNGSQQFIFKIGIFKSIASNFQSNIVIPYYRFQSFAVSLTYIIQYCDATGAPINTNDPVNISITSPQTNVINTQLTNTALSEVDLTVNTYTFPSNQNNQINASIILTSDSTVKSTPTLSFNTQPSPLIIKIIGGNRKIDYQSSATLDYSASDLDLQDQTVSQGITLTWICSDPSNIAQPCLDQNNQPFVINSNNPIIPASTFNPYTVIKITLKGTKDVRSYTDQIVALFIEFDLPVLNVNINLIDPLGQTVNLNEEIFTTLDYSTTVNPDILSFSSTIMYKDQVVSALKFDYTTLKFALWDTYSGFDRAQTAVSIRFSVFNPYFFMPSIQIVYLNINFPPNQCQFTISPTSNAANPVYSLQTVFTLSMQGCVDTNLPLSYQFFMYKSQTDFQYELVNPLQAKRRQLNDQSQSNSLLTILPQGDLIIMAAVSDSLQAIYNITLPLTVTDSHMSEAAYATYIDSALVTTGKTNGQIISSLSLIAEDLSLRADLASSTSINSRKISIIGTLKTTSLNLPIFSTFLNLSNKAVSSLLGSGITLSVSDQTTQLTDLQTTLAAVWTNTYQSLTDVQKTLRNQQVYDYYLITDQIMTNSQQTSVGVYSLQIDVSTKLGDKMNYNSLPNEDPKVFSGTTLAIQSQQVTEKNLCDYLFCTNYEPSATQTTPSPIYSLAYKTYYNNPYQNDTTFMNYTGQVSSLLNSKQVIQPTTFPIINPSVQTSTSPAGTSQIYNDDYQLQFKGKKQDNLTCLTKNSTAQWTQSGCKLIYSDKSKSYTCFCQSLGPTTIINDLQALINNKNLQTAFSSQGLSNLENWTTFYQYVAFWLILAKTIGFVVLYLKGKSLDEKFSSVLGINPQALKKANSNKIYPSGGSSQNLYKKQSVLFHEALNNKGGSSMSIPMQKLTKPQKFQKQLSNQPISLLQINEEVFSKEQNNVKTQITKEQIEKEINVDVEKKDQVLSKEVQENKSNHNVSIQLQQNDKEEVPQIENKVELSERNSGEGNILPITKTDNAIPQNNSSPEIKNSPDNNYDETPVPPTQQEQNEDSFNHQSNKSLKKKEPLLTETEYTQKSEKFVHISPWKQILYFHNFLGIFLIYDLEMPRPLRFSCFYVRIIHSFAVSIVFDASYDVAQIIALSIANSIIILVFLFMIETIFKKLKRGFLVVTLLALLGFYYYIILAIVSGQQADRSNLSMVSYVIFTLNDLLIVAFIVAFIQRYLALQMIQKQRLKNCQQKCITFLNLELILRSLI